MPQSKQSVASLVLKGDGVHGPENFISALEALVCRVHDLTHLYAAPSLCQHTSEQLTSAALPRRCWPAVTISISDLQQVNAEQVLAASRVSVSLLPAFIRTLLEQACKGLIENRLASETVLLPSRCLQWPRQLCLPTGDSSRFRPKVQTYMCWQPCNETLLPCRGWRTG